MEKDDRVIFGDGRARLLILIGETGSLRKAAEEMGMSYRHAWGIVKEMNAAAGKPLVTSERGGASGGRTVLTPLATSLLSEYEKTRREMERTLRYGRNDMAADAIIPVGDSIVLIKRKNPPFAGMYALPGGFLEQDETLEECVIREAREETGLDCEIDRLLGVFSALDRDPRGRTVSAVYILRPLSDTSAIEAGDDAADVKITPLSEVGSVELAFDHAEIISRYLELR